MLFLCLFIIKFSILAINLLIKYFFFCDMYAYFIVKIFPGKYFFYLFFDNNYFCLLIEQINIFKNCNYLYSFFKFCNYIITIFKKLLICICNFYLYKIINVPRETFILYFLLLNAYNMNSFYVLLIVLTNVSRGTYITF